MKRDGLRVLRPVLGGLLFAVALLVLDHQLREENLAEIRKHLAAIPGTVLASALVLTLLSYAALSLFDVLGLRALGRKLAYPRIALTSFVASVFSMDLGLSVLGSAAVRLRVYGLWGLSVPEITYVISFTVFAFSLGILGVGGLLFAIVALPLPDILRVSLPSTRPLGLVMLSLLAAGWLWLARAGRSLRVAGRDFPIPDVSLSLQALAAAARRPGSGLPELRGHLLCLPGFGTVVCGARWPGGLRERRGTAAVALRAGSGGVGLVAGLARGLLRDPRGTGGLGAG